MRLTTLLSLRLEDLSINGKVSDRIRVRRSTTKGKRAGYDMVLHPQAAQALQEYLDTDHRVMGYLFPGRSRSRLSRSQGWRMVKNIFKEVGIEGGMGELGAHAFRKTFCKLVYEALKYDLIKTAHAMKHASVSTTVQYLSFDEADVDSAILTI